MFHHLKFILIILCLSFLSACGGGSEDSTNNQTETETETETAIPSSILYQQGKAFKAGEIIAIESSQAFDEGEIIAATDETGRDVALIGKNDGEAILIIPTEVEPGMYTIKFSRGRLNFALTLEIESASFPINPEVYLEDFSDQLSSNILALELSDSVEDQAYKEKLLKSLEDFKAELPNLSNEELQTLSKYMYMNLDGLVSNQSALNFSAASNYSINASQDCPAAVIASIITVNLTYKAAAALLTPLPAPPQARALTDVFTLGATSLSLTSFALVRQTCFDQIIQVMNHVDTNVEANSFRVASLKRVSPVQYSSNNYSLAAATESPITFYDGDTKPISVIAEYELSPEALSVIKSFQDLVGSIETVIPGGLPDSFMTKIDTLEESVEKDVTSEVDLQQITRSDARCNGSTSGYTCSFPDSNQLHNEKVYFIYTVTHADAELPFTKNGILAPRDLPVINNQNFNLIPGSGQINRIEIQIAEDINSENYELTKVLGFELVTGPTYGVILNEFNEFGVLDYAADIIDDMPEQVALGVRVWNKYGYSEVATITLNFEELEGNFTKISSTGEDLPRSASHWSCVRDNVTDLVWEVKTGNNTGLHAISNYYRWGGVGAAQVGTEFYDDWNVLVDGSQGLCGFNDWRVPRADVLTTTFQTGAGEYSLLSQYFPYYSSNFWSSSVYENNSNQVLYVYFGIGFLFGLDASRSNFESVRLVRGEQ
jgi:hypothetical protein